MAWSGSLWVAAGLWTNSYTISISSDGINWQAAFNPLNYATQVLSPALSIAINPGVGIVIGGNWLRDNMVGSFSLAPATSLKFNWPKPNLIRPTLIFTDSVTVTNLQIINSKLLLLGRWISGGSQYGAISISSDVVTWSDAFLPHDTTYTNTTLYSIAESINLVIVGSIGNNAGQIGTMSVCINHDGNKNCG